MKKFVTCVNNEVGEKFSKYCEERGISPYAFISKFIHKVVGHAKNSTSERANKPVKHVEVHEKQRSNTDWSNDAISGAVSSAFDVPEAPPAPSQSVDRVQAVRNALAAGKINVTPVQPQRTCDKCGRAHGDCSHTSD